MEIITWKISIKQIIKDKRISFCEKFWHLVRESSHEAIIKVLQCWTTEFWFTTYKCLECSETKHIAFSCKSRFCNSCWKPQSDIRMDRLLARWPKWLQYYHLAFTIPEELRPFFKRHRKALKVLSKTASQSSLYFFESKHKCTPWILSVIHTFWAKLNRNPHVHLLITAGGVNESWAYKSVNFIPYLWVLHSWKRYLIKNLKDRCSENIKNPTEEIRYLNSFYSQKDEGDKDKSRYIYFSKRANSFKVVLWYIWRYLKRPTISQSRLINYNWEEVTYNYKDKYDSKTKEITCLTTTFIWLLIQHIPNKYFHMVHYYWIFANRCKHKYLTIINSYFDNSAKGPVIPKSFSERAYFFTWRNPLLCECWWVFCKYKITLPWYPIKYFDSW